MGQRKSGLILPGDADVMETPDGRKAIVLPSGELHIAEPPPESELSPWQVQQREIAQSGGYFAALRFARRIMGPSYVESIALRDINGRLP